MTWFGWIGLAVLVTVIAALTGIRPKGSQQLSRTHLMDMARRALLALVVVGILAYIVFRVRSHA